MLNTLSYLATALLMLISVGVGEESAEATVSSCLNSRSNFADGSYSGWTTNEDDEIKIENKGGRNKVLAIEDEDVYIATEFDVKPSRGYEFMLDTYGKRGGDDKARIGVLWYSAFGNLLSSTVLATKSFEEEWKSETFIAYAPLLAARAVWYIENLEDEKIYVDNLCVKSTEVNTTSECKVLNYDFSSGLQDWEYDANPGGYVVPYFGRAVVRDGYIRQTVEVDPLTDYQLTFDVNSERIVRAKFWWGDDDTQQSQVYAGNTGRSWHEINGVIFSRAGEAKLTLEFSTEEDKDFMLDNVCLTPIDNPATSCTVPNGNFSNGLHGWASVGDVSAGVYNGRQCVALQKDGQIRTWINIVGDVEYDFTYMLYGADKNDNEIIELLWRGPGGLISTQAVGNVKNPKRWEQQSFTVTAPSNAIAVTLRVSADSEPMYIDDLCWMSTLQPTGACLNVNGGFDFGEAGWNSGSNVSVEVISDAGDAALAVDGGWLATGRLEVQPSEEYFLNYRLNDRRPDLNLRNEVRWVDANNQVIRQEPVPWSLAGTGWQDYEFRLIAPANAVQAQLIWAPGAGAFWLDDVCIATGASRSVGCLADGEQITSWTRTNENDGGQFEPGYHDGVDGFRLSSTEVYTSFDVQEGQSYRNRLNLYGANQTSSPTTLRLTWHDVNGAILSSESFATAAFASEWQELVYRAVAPAGAVSARMYISNPAAEIYFALYCSIDAGEAGAAGVISGRVWADNDGDGVYSSSEPALGGSRLDLYRDNGDGIRNPQLDRKIDERISTSDGSDYLFTDLQSGDYYIVGYLLPTKRVSAFRVGFPDDDNDFESKSIDGVSVGMTPLLRISADNDIRDIDLGQKKSGKSAISGYIWNDADNSQYRNEPNSFGLNGVTLRTFSVATGQQLSETISQDDPYGNPGFYLFNYINAEPVYIELELPNGATLLTQQNDSKFDPLTLRTPHLSLLADQTITNVSAAFEVTGTEICDNGIDDDNDGRIDDRDSDCTSCVVAETVICGDAIRYYMPPMWQMNDGSGTTYHGPSYLTISTSTPEANVRIYKSDGTAIEDVTITSTTVAKVDLTKDLGQTLGYNQIETGKGIIVESDQPIQVLYNISGIYNKALVTIKGQQALGNKFRAGSQVAQYLCNGSLVGSNALEKGEYHFVSAMATEDNTTISFEWDETALTLAGGISSPHTVVLDRGETYLVRDDLTNQTVSGLGVISDKAITVVSGSQHTNVCASGLDAGIDQLVPECYVGTEYVLVKHKGLNNQHYAVVVATANDTEVRLDGSPAILATLDAGEWEKVMITGSNGDAHLISTSRPAYVFHFSGISINNEVGMGLASATGDCRGNTFLTFPTGNIDDDHNLNLVIPTDALSSVMLNGNALSQDPDVIIKPVAGNSALTSIVVNNTSLAPLNTLQAAERFQASLLIGKSGASGTYGYLTSFSQEIEVNDPATNSPSARYEIPRVCGGDSFEHTIDAQSCGSMIEIVEISNNASYGTAKIKSALTFTYDAKPEAYGRDNISVRIRDENGVERAVCVEVFICGASVPVYGLAPSQTLPCDAPVPVSNPYIIDIECPYLGEITPVDVRTEGSCPGNFVITRTWSAETACGTDIRAERIYRFIDNAPPTLSQPNSPVTVCGNVNVPVDDPTLLDNCDAAPILDGPSLAEVTNPGTNERTVTRTWTATDHCGNQSTTSQVVVYLAYPALTQAAVATDATCGQSNGIIHLDVASEATQTQVQFAINGVWQAPVSTSSGTVNYAGYAAGTYTISARWTDSSCPVDMGQVTIADADAQILSLSFYDIDNGTSSAIVNGTTYHRQDLPTRWNLIAEVSDQVGSVKFSISGGTVADVDSDNTVSYSYPPDGAALGWTHGHFIVDLDAMTGINASGTSCVSAQYDFYLINNEICDDGIDNDGDGFIDCGDEDCPKATPVRSITQG